VLHVGTAKQKTRWRTVHRVSEEVLAMQQVCLLLKEAKLAMMTKASLERSRHIHNVPYGVWKFKGTNWN
jgi:hypothetical protein